jgi:hypothetical protein
MNIAVRARKEKSCDIGRLFTIGQPHNNVVALSPNLPVMNQSIGQLQAHNVQILQTLQQINEAQVQINRRLQDM